MVPAGEPVAGWDPSQQTKTWGRGPGRHGSSTNNPGARTCNTKYIAAVKKCHHFDRRCNQTAARAPWRCQKQARVDRAWGPPVVSARGTHRRGVDPEAADGHANNYCNGPRGCRCQRVRGWRAPTGDGYRRGGGRGAVRLGAGGRGRRDHSAQLPQVQDRYRGRGCRT